MWKNEANTTISSQKYLKVVILRNQVSDEQTCSIFCYESIVDLFYLYVIMIWNKYIIKIIWLHNYALQENKYEHFKESILQPFEQTTLLKCITVGSPITSADRSIVLWKSLQTWSFPCFLFLTTDTVFVCIILIMRLNYSCILFTVHSYFFFCLFKWPCQSGYI